MQQNQQLKLLAIVAAGFILPALAIIGLQLIPATARPLGYMFAPYYAGILMQLMLLVIAGLAIVGEVPRWALAAPLAVWTGGIGYWWVERGHILDRMRARAQPIELASKTNPIVITGANFSAAALAQNLIAEFSVQDVYAEQKSTRDHLRYSLATGDACGQSVENRRLRQPWQPERLKAKGECVIREKGSPPPGGMEVAVGTLVPISLQVDAAYTPIEFAVRGDANASKTRIDVVAEHAPLPILLPIAGCMLNGKPEKHECVLKLARSPFPINPDSRVIAAPISLLSFVPTSNFAFYVGGALGLPRREAMKTAAP